MFTTYFQQVDVYELPRGFNFRPNGGIRDNERCDAHVVHTSSTKAKMMRPEISRELYTRHCFPNASSHVSKGQFINTST